jgi:hypothetical protein
MTGSIKLKDHPGDMVRFTCEKCGRAGQYSKQHLIWRFGPDIPLPDLRTKIANCEREGKMHDACGVHYEGLT